MSKLPLIGITIGDINSISVEVIIKALHDNRILDYCTPVVYASPKIISYWRKILNLNDFQLNIIKSLDQVNPKKANLLACWEEELEIKPGEVSEVAGKYAFKSLEMTTKDAVSGKLQAIVTGPLNKHNVNTDTLPFNGHTEYLAQQANSEHLMVLTADSLRVALVTGHLPLKDVSLKLSQSLIAEKIVLLNKSLIQDFGIIKPKIAVLGLNPHAGENGLLGSEEIRIIIPSVDKTRNDKQISVYGPYPADGFFGSNQYKQFDGILAMYHDQGLIPFKFMAFKDGVNYTAGLPFVRTSPDHGTAYAIAGKNEADAQSMRNAIYTAIDIWARRNHFQTINENPLPMTQFRREKFRIDF